MPIKIIGKSILGEIGLSQNVSVMGDCFEEQLLKVVSQLRSSASINSIAMTSMTNSKEVEETKGKYFPKIRLISDQYDPFYGFLMPQVIYNGCKAGLDKYKPCCDFIIWDRNKFNHLAVLTFSREAPILAFESTNGKKALGMLLRASFMEYGEYLFSTMQEALGGCITVHLVTCNHFNYTEGSVPAIVRGLADKYEMRCVIGTNSETNSECYYRGEIGNHVVAMW